MANAKPTALRRDITSIFSLNAQLSRISCDGYLCAIIASLRAAHKLTAREMSAGAACYVQPLLTLLVPSNLATMYTPSLFFEVSLLVLWTTDDLQT